MWHMNFGVHCSLFSLVVPVKTFTGRLVDIYFLHAGRHHGHHPARAPGRGWALPDGWPRVRGRSADHLLSTRHARHGQFIWGKSIRRSFSDRKWSSWRSVPYFRGVGRELKEPSHAGAQVLRRIHFGSEKGLQVTCARQRGACDQQSSLL